MSRKQINSLISLLQRQCNVAGGKPSQLPRTRRRRRRRSRNNPSVIPPPGQPGMPRTNNPRLGRTVVTGDNQAMRVSREELVQVVATTPGGVASGAIQLHPNQFIWLKGLAASFDRAVWLKVRLNWRSFVGTGTDGNICYACDWASSDWTPTRDKVLAISPVADHPVWLTTDDRPLILPISMLQTRREYILRSADAKDAQPGRIVYYVSGAPANKTVGEIWASYTIVFSGPRATE